jgi:hypothetical protein
MSYGIEPTMMAVPEIEVRLDVGIRVLVGPGIVAAVNIDNPEFTLFALLCQVAQDPLPQGIDGAGICGGDGHGDLQSVEGPRWLPCAATT